MWYKRDVGLHTPEAQAVRAELYALGIVFVLLALICVIARLYVRIKARTYGLEDWLAVVAMVGLGVNLALLAILIENGLGMQAEHLSMNQQINIARTIYAAEPEYVIGIGIVKISILIMYCRVFDTRPFRIAAWIIGSFTMCWTIVFVFVCLFQCWPIARAWDPRIAGSCMNLNAIWIGNAIPNIVTDVVILSMPIYPVWKLRMRKSQRVAVLGIFLLGGFVVIASIYRLTQILTLNPLNLAFTLKGGAIFSHVELAVAIMSSCLPTLKPLFESFMKAIGMGSSKGSSANNGPSGGATGSRPFYQGGSGGAHASHDKNPKSSGFTVIDEVSDGRRSEAAGSEVSINRGYKREEHAPPSRIGPYSSRLSQDIANDDIAVPMGDIRIQNDVEIDVVRRESSDRDARLTDQFEEERKKRWYPSGPTSAL